MQFLTVSLSSESLDNSFGNFDPRVNERLQDFLRYAHSQATKSTTRKIIEFSLRSLEMTLPHMSIRASFPWWDFTKYVRVEASHAAEACRGLYRRPQQNDCERAALRFIEPGYVSTLGFQQQNFPYGLEIGTEWIDGNTDSKQEAVNFP